MQRFALIAAFALLGSAGAASASSFIGTTDAIAGSLVNTVEGTSDATTGNNKIILDARDDAASFVGSNGEIRGAYLESALNHLREQQPDLNASDMQLAEAILAR